MGLGEAAVIRQRAEHRIGDEDVRPADVASLHDTVADGGCAEEFVDLRASANCRVAPQDGVENGRVAGRVVHPAAVSRRVAAEGDVG